MTREDIQKLSDEIKVASDAYYNTGKSLMTDAEFDAKVEELALVDPSNDFFSEVGSDLIPDKEKVDVGYKMFSTDKSLSIQEMVPFWNRVQGATEYVASNKVDGLATNLVYENGKLVMACTRGNGTVGRIFTQKALKMQDKRLPKRASGFSGKVRGEVYLTDADFEKLNAILLEEGSEPQDNCRNSAAGLINSGLAEMKNASKKLQLLSFRAYGVYDDEDPTTDIFGSYENYSEQLDKAKQMGFETVEYTIFRTREQVEIFLQSAKEWLKHLGFPNDGIVIRVNNQEFARKKGAAKKYLNAVTAFKFAPEMALATVKDIIWQQGSTEYTPVIIIEPTELAGAVINRVGGHSVKNLIELEAYPGNKIALVRSGEVIPRGYNRRVYDELNA